MKKTRVLWKISGESLSSENKIFSNDSIKKISTEIATVYNNNTEICIVIGGGNIWRNRDTKSMNLNRSTSDKIGMYATLLNAKILSDSLKQINIKSEVFSAISSDLQISRPYSQNDASVSIADNVVIFAGGIGNP